MCVYLNLDAILKNCINIVTDMGRWLCWQVPQTILLTGKKHRLFERKTFPLTRRKRTTCSLVGIKKGDYELHILQLLSVISLVHQNLIKFLRTNVIIKDFTPHSQNTQNIYSLCVQGPMNTGKKTQIQRGLHDTTS
jgi:hypothetical protein